VFFARQVGFRYLAAIVVALAVCQLHAQVASTEAGVSLQKSFQGFIERFNSAQAPKDDELLRIADGIPGTRSDDVSKAIPSFCAALLRQDDRIKLAGAFMLTIVAQRSDGAALLTPHVDCIGRLLNLPDERLQAAGVGIFAFMKPSPPSSATKSLIEYLTRTDRNPMAQANALSLLLRIAPENSEVTSAVDKFLSQSLSLQVREAVLNGIANTRTENPHFTNILIAALNDRDKEIRFQVAQAFQRMPKEAVLQAQPALQKMIENPRELVDIQNAAREALKRNGLIMQSNDVEKK